MQSFSVNDKPIWAGSGCLEKFSEWLEKNANGRRIIILSDVKCAGSCYPVFSSAIPDRYQPELIIFPGGEESKSFEIVDFILHKLLQHQVERNDLLINLGGGVTTDLGGFCASIYKRGISFINIPTSVTGMIDAAIGGKNGIDVNGIKNLAGVFNFPELVISDPVFLKTLPRRQFIAGMAEAARNALIADQSLWDDMLTAGLTEDLVTDRIGNIIKVKADLVNTDPFDRKERQALNFGHTIGHALESYSLEHDEEPLMHGEAVLEGMIAEIQLSVWVAGLNPPHAKQLQENLISIFGRFKRTPVNPDTLLNLIAHDKKNLNRSVHFSLLKKIGTAITGVEVTLADIRKLLVWYDES